MKLSVVVSAIKNAAQALGIKLEHSYSSIQLLVDLGLFIKTVYLSDRSVALDTVVKAFLTAKSDSAAVVDDVSASFTKSLTDNGAVSEDAVLAYLKNLTDAASVVEQFSFELLRGVEDQASTTDDKTLAIAKQLFSEVSFTDDVDGQASLEDDQEMQFFKLTSNTSTVSDTFVAVMDYVRQAQDELSFSDALELLVGKEFESLSSVAEAANLGVGKTLEDILSIPDAIAIDLGTSFTHGAATLDQYALELQKAFDHTSSVLDEIFIVRGKKPFDDMTVSDLEIRSFDKSLLHIAGVLDDLERTVQFSRSFDESTLLSDTGSLRSQGYCDFTYFAEDYVGASRTF